MTFHPGVYSSAAAVSNTGTMTLDADGNSNAVFIFQVNAALSSAASSKVVLTDGALANSVYWQVVGAVSLGAGSKYVGTFLGAAAITFGDGAGVKGRALTPATITVTNSPFTNPVDDLTAPVVTINGGPTRSTNDTSPTISGTTVEPVGSDVTVTVGGQTLSSTVAAGGVWGVSASALAAQSHNVEATITDASRNVGTATQVLTVDVTAPVVTINGGATKSTNDTTPSISGTTNEPGSPTVTVTVGGQTLTTTSSSGIWSVDATTLTEAPHTIVASVDDAAQNTGTANQVLSVDVTLPVVTLDGGAARSTEDTSPWIFGTTAEQAGTPVLVTVGGQTLNATTLSGGTWGVSATTLSPGSHTVVASITDAAQNTGTATQVLTVDVTGPAVTINGGNAMSTNDTTPSISGTTNEPGSPTLTVTVGGQTLTTTASHAGTWSVDAAILTEAPHTVVASVDDGTQNTGTATQVLTVDLTAPAVTINGGSTKSTNDTTPSISGTTNESGSPTLTVTVGGQTLTTTASHAGTWSVDAAILTEGPHTIVASVDDAAQNTGTASQVLSVDVTLPVVTLSGGAARSTEDTSPWIFGTTAEQAGTPVLVTVNGQTLNATASNAGTWGVNANTLPLGSHTVVVSITDAAQNTGTATQTLTITATPVPPTPPLKPAYRPDSAIRTLSGSFVGGGIFDLAKQRVSTTLGRARTATFVVLVTNRGRLADQMVIRGTAGTKAYKVMYLANGRNVTGAVQAGTYRTTTLAPGGSVLLGMKVTRTKSARRGSGRTFEVRAGSTHLASARDTVSAGVRR